jgi:hypothetical protein
VDFDFHLTGKATASWNVLTGFGENVSAPPFPTGGTFTPGNPAQGELICFAVDTPVLNQIAFNHLTGTATVINAANKAASQS